MTVRKAKVVGTSELGPSSHGGMNDRGETIFDMTPDRDEIRIQGVNCSAAEFTDWFLTVETYHERYDLLASEDGTVWEDIGGSSWDLSVGATLEVSFEAYFDSLVAIRIEQANRELNRMVAQAKAKLHGRVH